MSTEMLDVFANFTIDDGFCSEEGKRRSSEPTIRPDEYIPAVQYKGWFFDEELVKRHKDPREYLRYQAEYAYLHREYKKALMKYEELFNSYEHKGTVSFAVLYSLVQSAIKERTLGDFRLNDLLENHLASLISSYSDQLQFWDICLQFYSDVTANYTSALKYAILLCSSVDLPEHWLLLGKPTTSGNNPRMRVGAMCRALNLLKIREKNSKGFVRALTQVKISRLDAKINEEFPQNVVKEAIKNVCFDLSKPNFPVISRDFLPPHISRSKGLLKNATDQAAMIESFVRRFRSHWSKNGGCFYSKRSIHEKGSCVRIGSSI
ncbi:hypothetical protein AB6A40_005484 [Gnathostoma spinigerum]|uniref:Uncharacterized protein n=1 Tax=Gnathostoma spinigerum TaxID=75299 RepID=A0ABD6EGP7_9BILA